MNLAASVQPGTPHKRQDPPRNSDPSQTGRADGWTPSRIRTFLDTLAECGVVADAARAAGMSPQGAYAFRNSARGRAFDTAWRAALLLARRRLADEVMSRALNGCVEVIIRDGEVWGERHRFDNRLTMAVLTRLDALADSMRQLDDGPRRVAHEFEAFVDSVCAGGDEPTDFLRARAELPYRAFGEAQILERNAAYLLAREQGGEVEWQLTQDSPPPDPNVALGTGSVVPEPDSSVPDGNEVGAVGAGEAAEEDLPSAHPVHHGRDQDETVDRAAEDRPDARGGGDEWQPSTSSTSLDSPALSEAGEPAPGAFPPGVRTSYPQHAHRANRVQPAARLKSCVVRAGETSAGRSPYGLVPPSGAPR